MAAPAVPRRGVLDRHLRVRRDPRHRELWWVGRLDYSGTWRIAGTGPCCPLCGSELAAGMQVSENAG